jgi:UDP-N-acetylglucosamine--N-acetylmuramyl-(pentapeptide) pyrophosphoryl-undecaprenol N-acetylglucosamine transferase
LEAALLEVSDMRKLCNNGGCDIKRNDICARFWNAILSFSTKGEGSIECA